MRLSIQEIEELNNFLQDKDLDIPEFRRFVTSTGANYKWLQKNITVKNTNIPDRLKYLLALIK